MISTEAHNDSNVYAHKNHRTKHSLNPNSLSIKFMQRRKHHQAFMQCLAQTIASSHGAAKSKYRHMRLRSESQSEKRELTESFVYRNRSLHTQSYHFRQTV